MVHCPKAGKAKRAATATDIRPAFIGVSVATIIHQRFIEIAYICSGDKEPVSMPIRSAA
jgi:hypothetical protein